jgi:hypothetical protein
MDQNIFNWVIGISGALMGWVLKVIWDSLRDLKNDLKEITTNIHREYVRKDDFRDAMQDIKADMREIKELIGAIFKRLENKADREK